MGLVQAALAKVVNKVVFEKSGVVLLRMVYAQMPMVNTIGRAGPSDLAL